jgi:DNA polymerase (family 10)
MAADDDPPVPELPALDADTAAPGGFDAELDASAVASQLRDIASYLGLAGERYRAIAYDKAAASIEAVHDLGRLIAEKRLTSLPGIGDSLAGVVEELAHHGSSGILLKLRERWPPMLLELARLPRIGPDKARALHEALHPASLDELAEMAAAGRVRGLKGFGKVSETRLLEALRERHTRSEQLLLPRARELGAAFAAYARRGPGVRVAEAGGPARRACEIVDHLALAIGADDAGAARDWMRRHPQVSSVTEHDALRTTLHLASGLRVDVVIVPPAAFGLAHVIATGGDGHLAGLGALAAERGLALASIVSADEAAVYAALGLPWLPPEIRDGTDEIRAALAGERFDDLVTIADVTGAVHCHTLYSDGKSTVEAMARAAEARRLGFITITDHSPTASYAGGLDPSRLETQWAEIADVQARVGVRLLRGTESDILADGRLDFPDEVLGALDVVVASIHNRYGLDEDGMTRRLVTAMRHPVFKIWGHALGRLLLRREPVACRFDEVLDAIGEGHAAIEINGDPRRLDLDPERARQAHARGIRFVLSSDAHATNQLDYLENAVAMARRARLRPRDILNTLPAEEFARAVRPVRSTAA